MRSSPGRSDTNTAKVPGNGAADGHEEAPQIRRVQQNSNLLTEGVEGESERYKTVHARR